jgi:hypothetical protein
VDLVANKLSEQLTKLQHFNECIEKFLDVKEDDK